MTEANLCKTNKENADTFGNCAVNTSIIFTGDIGFDKYMDGKWEDEELIAPEILDFLASADHVVANVEGPLQKREDIESDEGTAQLLHTMNPEVTKVLKKIKADIWSINNNHIMDAGQNGLRATLSEAKKFGAKTIGAGMNIKDAARPIILEESGGIGIFAVGYRRGCKPADEQKGGCLLWNDMETIAANISRIKANCRWCIIAAHGGEEFTSLPSPYTRERYLGYLKMGADIVVCHHPHVPMNYEIVESGEDRKAIFYSLGNFIFDTDYQRAQFNTEKGILLKLNISENGFTFEPFGMKIERGSEKIIPADLPEIFRNVPADEYEKLAPLAAKMFVAATKRQQIFLNKDMADFTDEQWHEHFFQEKRSGRVPGEALDFQIICPLADRAEEGAWKQSKLTEVVDYIQAQI